MSTRILAKILKGMIAVTVFGAILFFVLMCGNMTEVAFRNFFVYFVVAFLLWHMILSIVPVRCDKPGCNGWMHHHWVKESDSEYKLQFVCNSCGDVYDTDIGMSIEGGQPW